MTLDEFFAEAKAKNLTAADIFPGVAERLKAADSGWLEAAVAWEVCASIHEKFAKGKDALYTTRHADFVQHAADARAKVLPPAQPAPMRCAGCDLPNGCPEFCRCGVARAEPPTVHDEVRELRAEIERLSDELMLANGHRALDDLARRDAARFRYLEKHDPRFGMPIAWLSAETLAAAVDESMRQDEALIAAWRERYIVRLMQSANISRGEAADNFEAINGMFGQGALWSLDDEPEDVADAEAQELRAAA